MHQKMANHESNRNFDLNVNSAGILRTEAPIINFNVPLPQFMEKDTLSPQEIKGFGKVFDCLIVTVVGFYSLSALFLK